MANHAEHLKPYQFKPGHKVTHTGGQRTAGKVAQLHARMIDVMTAEVWQECTEKLVEIVRHGKHKDAIDAFALLCNRILGKAKETISLEVNERPQLDPENYSQDQIDALLNIVSNPANMAAIDVTPLPVTTNDELPTKELL